MITSRFQKKLYVVLDVDERERKGPGALAIYVHDDTIWLIRKALRSPEGAT